MAQLNYYLKNKNVQKTNIYLSFTYDGYRFQTSTGIKISPKMWDVKRGTIRQIHLAKEDIKAKQELLNKRRSLVLSEFNSMVEIGSTIYFEKVKSMIKDIYTTSIRKSIDTMTFFNAFDSFIETHLMFLSPRTIKKYKTVRRKLMEYEITYSEVLSFDNIDMPFYNRFRSMMLKTPNPRNPLKIGLLNDSISKYVSTVKTFMQWAMDAKYHSNEEFLKFATPKVSKHEIVTLTEEEIRLLEKVDLSQFPTLEETRDIFLFSYYTARRISEMSSFNKKDLVSINSNWYWKSFSPKTKKSIHVPLFGARGIKAYSILRKYDFQMPLSTEQKYNSDLKALGKHLELDRLISIHRQSGSTDIHFEGPLYEFIVSHTARRSAITIMLEKGISPTTVMKLTGHSDLKTLMKYENTSQEALDDVFKMTHL